MPEVAKRQYLSLPDTVTEQLRTAIINGDIPPGQRLLEAALAEEFDVSRSIIRAAIARLETERLVEVRARRGAVVIQMSREESMEVCEARALLEWFAAQAAVQKLTAADLAEMRSCAQDMADAFGSKDMMSFVQLDNAFHRKIAACTGNRRVFGLWESLDAQLGALLSSTADVRRLTPDIVRQRHLRVVEAIETRDVQLVETVLRRHYVDIWPD